MKKPFLTYKEQIEKLQTIKKIQCSEDDITILIKNGYFNLINGYKEIFVKDINNGSHRYIDDATIRSVEIVKEFDFKLRMLFMKNISKIEEEIRTIFCHVFIMCNEGNEASWKDINSYYIKIDNKEHIEKLIKNIEKQLNESRNEYIQHYKKKYNEYPAWIAFKIMRFSTLIDTIKLSKVDVVKKICEVYKLPHKKNFDSLPSTLRWLKEIRNACAHNERVYNIFNEKIYRKNDIFNQANMRRSYTNKKSLNAKLIDAIVSIKYFLTPAEYKKFIKEFITIYKDVKVNLSEIAFEKIRIGSGIKNFEDINDLLKVKYYNSYDLLYDI